MLSTLQNGLLREGSMVLHQAIPKSKTRLQACSDATMFVIGFTNDQSQVTKRGMEDWLHRRTGRIETSTMVAAMNKRRKVDYN